MTRQREHVEKLLRKAEEDETILFKVIDDPEVADTSIGFHAQQGIEKIIKSLLTAKGVNYRKTHDISQLISVLEKSGCNVPEKFMDLDLLTEYAGNLRYDDIEDENLDREQIKTSLKSFKKWALSEIDELLKS